MSNPFSTRFIRPGAIPFIFPPGNSLDSLLQQLEKQNWWGQIIGPHGSGKSTLLAGLIPALNAAGRGVVHISLHQNQHRLPPLDRLSLHPTAVLIIDGNEQLSWWQRRRIKSICRRCGAGLLVTAHSDTGLPTLYTTESTEPLVTAVVARLLPDGEPTIRPDDISAAFAKAGGNLREMLFQLYDVYQARRP